MKPCPASPHAAARHPRLRAALRALIALAACVTAMPAAVHAVELVGDLGSLMDLVSDPSRKTGKGFPFAVDPRTRTMAVSQGPHPDVAALAGVPMSEINAGRNYVCGVLSLDVNGRWRMAFETYPLEDKYARWQNPEFVHNYLRELAKNPKARPLFNARVITLLDVFVDAKQINIRSLIEDVLRPPKPPPRGGGGGGNGGDSSGSGGGSGDDGGGGGGSGTGFDDELKKKSAANYAGKKTNISKFDTSNKILKELVAEKTPDVVKPLGNVAEHLTNIELTEGNVRLKVEAKITPEYVRQLLQQAQPSDKSLQAALAKVEQKLIADRIYEVQRARGQVIAGAKGGSPGLPPDDIGAIAKTRGFLKTLVERRPTGGLLTALS